MDKASPKGLAANGALLTNQQTYGSLLLAGPVITGSGKACRHG